jgi:hypothetical protein
MYRVGSVALSRVCTLWHADPEGWTVLCGRSSSVREKSIVLRRVRGDKPTLLLVVTSADRVLALDQDRCIQILRECGYLPTGPIGLVNLGQIPVGLNAEDLV